MKSPKPRKMLPLTLRLRRPKKCNKKLLTFQSFWSTLMIPQRKQRRKRKKKVAKEDKAVVDEQVALVVVDTPAEDHDAESARERVRKDEVIAKGKKNTSLVGEEEDDESSVFLEVKIDGKTPMEDWLIARDGDIVIVTDAATAGDKIATTKKKSKKKKTKKPSKLIDNTEKESSSSLAVGRIVGSEESATIASGDEDACLTSVVGMKSQADDDDQLELQMSGAVATEEWSQAYVVSTNPENPSSEAVSMCVGNISDHDNREQGWADSNDATSSTPRLAREEKQVPIENVVCSYGEGDPDEVGDHSFDDIESGMIAEDSSDNRKGASVLENREKASLKTPGLDVSTRSPTGRNTRLRVLFWVLLVFLAVAITLTVVLVKRLDLSHDTTSKATGENAVSDGAPSTVPGDIAVEPSTGPVTTPVPSVDAPTAVTEQPSPVPVGTVVLASPTTFPTAVPTSSPAIGPKTQFPSAPLTSTSAPTRGSIVIPEPEPSPSPAPTLGAIGLRPSLKPTLGALVLPPEFRTSPSPTRGSLVLPESAMPNVPTQGQFGISTSTTMPTLVSIVIPDNPPSQQT